MGTCYRPPFFPEILQFSFVRCERSRRGGYTVGQAPQLVYVADLREVSGDLVTVQASLRLDRGG